MTTPEQYREVIRTDNRWEALRLYRSDIGRSAYRKLTDDEKMSIDLLCDMALESL